MKHIDDYDHVAIKYNTWHYHSYLSIFPLFPHLSSPASENHHFIFSNIFLILSMSEKISAISNIMPLDSTYCK